MIRFCKHQNTPHKGAMTINYENHKHSAPQLEISINGTTFKIRAGNSPTLPRHVLLGWDIGSLAGLAVREVNVFSVLTQLQKRKQEREDKSLGEPNPKPYRKYM